MQLTILNILQDSASRWFGEKERLVRPVREVSTDSRTIQPGDLFFALSGEAFDGQQFVQEVLQKGALAAVVSTAWHEQHADVQNVVVVQDPLTAFQESAAAYRRRFDIPTIAVTGSVGKTTAKEMMYSVLSRRFNVLRNKKSFNNHVGVPATLFALRPGHEILVAELGTNHFGELDRLSALVEPMIAVITNIGYAHLEFFGDLAGVSRAKFEIFNHCRPGAVAIYNADDVSLAKGKFPLDSFAYGYEQSADLHGEVLGCDEEACYRFKLLGRVVQLRVPGRHNISNALAAAAVAVRLRLTPEEIRDGLENFTAADQRMQIIRQNGMVLINDSYNANPVSCAAALDTCADFKSGSRVVAVLGDMLELGPYTEAEHSKLAERAQSAGVDALFLFGQHTRHTLQRAQELAMPAVFHFQQKELLTRALQAFIKPGDVVLFKGSRGMRMETLLSDLTTNHES